MNELSSRSGQLRATLSDMPEFRLKQAESALFQCTFKSWNEVLVLPEALRTAVAASVPWMTLSNVAVLESARHDTYKAVLATVDGERIETVLMRNKRGWWSVCVSSQVGCAMKCSFCATGTMGFTRNLLVDEIVDQYRFWKYFLTERPTLPQEISNVVYMGMGEPLANYDNVKASLETLLSRTTIGPTRITVSTVGLIPMLTHILDDADWPPVRLAVSLHSADANTRKKMMPSSYDGFLLDLSIWAKTYFSRFESRRRHITFEYILLSGVNDAPEDAEKLVRFAYSVGRVRVNVIPYNATSSPYGKSPDDAVDRFVSYLKEKGVAVTKRRAMGDDIAAACGQLVVETKR